MHVRGMGVAMMANRKHHVTIPDRLRHLINVHRRAFVTVIVAVSLLMWAVVGVSAWFASEILTELPGNDRLRTIETMAQATTLLDVHDTPAFTIFEEQRIEVPLSSISPHLIRAIIAIEDQRFYDHAGVDFVRVVGAAITNLRKGRVAQGGSTITQQLVRQSFLSRNKTIRRKLKEIVLAERLEREFTKNEILQLYLNKVYFGDGLYGVEAASLGFFGKHASDVDVAEAALLAGLVKSPSAYAPTIDRTRALARRNVVLQAMRDARVIDRATYERAYRSPLRLQDVLRREETYGQYFKEEVRKQLVDRFGWQRVAQGGLRVYTTIDLGMQKMAETEVQRALDEIEKKQARRRSKNAHEDDSSEPLQAALVALDPTTGEVRAMVGGRSFDESRFNRAMQAHRQPGSAFKPFVYAAALERGFTAASLITNLDAPIMTLQGAWVPEDGHSAGDAITMRTALRTSSNRAAVRVLEQVGIRETVRYAERFGVGSLPSVPSLALGSGEVTLLSMTAAFAAFANQGMVFAPTLIRRVETTDGEVLYGAAQQPQRAISEATAYIMTTMLADVVNAGTAWQARRVGFTLPAAGKTGTTNDYHDAWFVGYTPKIVAGVWLGYDQPRTILANGYAGDLAVPLWGRFMKTATEGDEPVWFRAPRTVVSANVCRQSGKLPAAGCSDALVVGSDGLPTRRSQVYTEYFVRGTEPIDLCPIHQTFMNADAALSTVGAGGGVPAARSARGGVEAAAPAVPVATTGTVPAAASRPGFEQKPQPSEQKQDQRRGSWWRIFRNGSDAPATTPDPKTPHDSPKPPNE
jgi:1A family penicillin-binding protein